MKLAATAILSLLMLTPTVAATSTEPNSVSRCASPQPSATETIIWNFESRRGRPWNPIGGLIADSAGDLYGTTQRGGPGFGIVYELIPQNVGYSLKVIYDFQGGPNDGFDPQFPLLSVGGSLYGTTLAGGAKNVGTVFRLFHDAHGSLHNAIYSFQGPPADTAYPDGPLVFDGLNSLYGTTNNALFRITLVDEKLQERVVHLFDDGTPFGPVAIESGSIYGVMEPGRSGGYGLIFKIEMPRKYAVVYRFHGPPNDGYGPASGLISGIDGALYGTTYLGGRYGYGMAFRVDPTALTHRETDLYDFKGPPADGANPNAPFVTDGAGDLFATTTSGGSSNKGTVFELTPARFGYRETVLHSFTGPPDGEFPGTSLLLVGRTLYGVTKLGGLNRFNGTAFAVTP